MKTAALLLLLVNLNDVFCNDFALSKALSEKSQKKNVQILISKKFFKPLKKKHLPANKEYTVFPKVSTVYTAFPKYVDNGKKVYSVPESPLFSMFGSEPKTRVKKVLQDYPVSVVRSKRSADLKKQDDATVKKETKAVSKVQNKTKAASGKPSKKVKRRQSKHKQSRKMKNHKTNGTRKTGHLKHPRRSRKAKGNGTKALKKSGRSRKRNNNAKAIKKKESRRLIMGKDVTIEMYPYMVSIQKDDDHWCSGAILNPRLVITTANCIWKANRVSRLRIRAGSRFTDHGGQKAKIAEARKHPKWTIRSNPDNDVALLLLDRNLRFSDSVHGVDLPNRIMLPAFEDAWVTSWGAERRDGVYDKTSVGLHSVHTRLMDRGKCNNVTQRFGVYVTENFICLSQMGKRAPCTRDTGAPAVSDGILWGLASWGIRKLCGTQRFPAMFSYLASHSNMDFIINATHELMAEERFNPIRDM